ncbi:MAG: putative nickel-responsive regulator [Phycisphaerae bacterium]|nr:putative nickel-responsive regulator [Phycisphaerae bacterium]
MPRSNHQADKSTQHQKKTAAAALIRFSVSMEQTLLDQLDDLMKHAGYDNRSEYIRDLVREHLVSREWAGNEIQIGTIFLLYDHHARGLSARLTHEQHHFQGHVLATTHIHLDERLCAEMIMVRGRGHDIQFFTERLHREKGVLLARLTAGSTGKKLL